MDKVLPLTVYFDQPFMLSRQLIRSITGPLSMETKAKNQVSDEVALWRVPALVLSYSLVMDCVAWPSSFRALALALHTRRDLCVMISP